MAKPKMLWAEARPDCRKSSHFYSQQSWHADSVPLGLVLRGEAEPNQRCKNLDRKQISNKLIGEDL